MQFFVLFFLKVHFRFAQTFVMVRKFLDNVQKNTYM